MKITLHLNIDGKKETVRYVGITKTYMKDGFYCMYDKVDNKLVKYRVNLIVFIEEDLNKVEAILQE